MYISKVDDCFVSWSWKGMSWEKLLESIIVMSNKMFELKENVLGLIPGVDYWFVDQNF